MLHPKSGEQFPDQPPPASILKVNGTFYHFHPIAILRSAKEIKKLEAWQYVQNHMPSYRDFISLAEILKILKASGIQKKFPTGEGS